MKQTIKKSLAVFLALLTLCSVFAVSVFALDKSVSFSVLGCGENENTSTNWWYNSLDKKYYVFLPDGSDLSALKVSFTGAENLFVGDKKLTSGEVTDAFSAGGEFTVSDSSNNYKVVFMQSDNIPAFYIKTESGSLDAIHADKSHKEAAEISIINNGELTLEAPLDYIKGRGNTTWGAPKKPYNIKFEKKTDLFGMGKAKKWSLLASYFDKSLIRNTTVFGLAEDAGLAYTSKSMPIDLYINGEYLGNYLLCESVEIGSSRVDIDDLEDLNEEANPDIDVEACPLGGTRGWGTEFTRGTQKWVEIPNDPENIKGGYLLEFEMYERYETEVSGFVSNNGQHVILKSPEFATKNEVMYISSLYQEAEDAFFSENGYNSLGKHYSEYLDMESLVRMYLLQEIVMNLDASMTSFYIYKPADSDKFFFGPVWDFDYCLGCDYIRYGANLNDPSDWYANMQYIYDMRENEKICPPEKMNQSILAQLFKHKDFRDAVKLCWKEVYLPLLGNERFEKFEADVQRIEASAVMNAIRWNSYSSTDYQKNLDLFDQDIVKVEAFFNQRVESMKKGLSDNAAFVFYDANGGEGFMGHDQMLVIGEKAVLLPNRFFGPGDNGIFVGWNTQPDGSGTTYMPGRKITVEGEATTLYAQWAKGKPTINNGGDNFFFMFINRIISFFAQLAAFFEKAFA